MCFSFMPPRPIFLLALLAMPGAWAAPIRPAAPDFISGQYSHRIWHIEDGLPQNRIYAITQTPDGYLWVGTSDGLARFDGTRFTVFDRTNTPAFEDSSILALRLTRDGALWIGTEGGGLVRYRNGEFRHFGPAAGLSNGFVRCIFEDREGVLWIGTDRGFFRLQGSAFVRLDGTPGVPLASVVSIAQDAAGRLWVNSPNRLMMLAGGRLLPSDCGGPRIGALVPSRRGFLWAVDVSGLSRIQGGCPAVDKSLPALPMRSLAEDSQGDTWLGTAGMGLFRLAGHRLDRFTSSSILPDDTVRVIFEDRDENLWIGGDDGLLRLRRSRIAGVGKAEGLEDDDVLTTYADRDSVWFVTLRGQVYRVRGSAVSRFRLPPPAEHAHVRTMLRARDGSLWFGTNGEGVIRCDGRRATLYAKADGLRSNVVRQLLQDRAGAIWMALDSGVSRWDGSRFRNYYLEDGLSYPSARSLLEDAGGDILVGTDSGLNRFHHGAIAAGPEFALVARERIWAIHEQPAGTLWLGTRGGGLLRLHAGKLTRFNIANGLPSNSIYQILADRAGKLWMSSSLGVFSADPTHLNGDSPDGADSINVTWFGTADGMKTAQMNGGVQPAGARDGSGALWFPTVKGAVRINPLTIPVRSIPPLLIERLVVDGAPVPLSKEVTIPPGHRDVEIDFTLCDLVAAQPTRFRYKLEGLDENWNSSRGDRSVFYSNLKPGHYRFHVRARDPYSASSASEATLAFTLRPEFYQTAWFFGLAALACGGLIWGGMLLYARLMRTRYSLVLGERMAERSRLAREIHDTVIQGCVGVSTLLEAMDRCRGVDTARAGSLLDDARAQIRSTVEEARQAIWDLRYASARNASIAMLFDLARKLGAEQHIEVETEMAGQGRLGTETDRTLLLVGREALRNAAIHARPAHIRIGIGFRASAVVLEVRDDGIGFPAAVGLDTRKHFGMIGMRERIEKLGGSLAVESAPGKGTRVTATVPLPRHAAEEF